MSIESLGRYFSTVEDPRCSGKVAHSSERDAVLLGATQGEAAVRFGVSAARASRWRTLQRERGDVRPGPLGSGHRSDGIEAVAPLALEALDQTRDATIDELRRMLGNRGHWFGCGTLRRLFTRPGITHQKRPPVPPSRTGPIC